MNRDVPSSFDYSGACDGIGGLFRSLVYSFDVSPHSGTSGGQRGLVRWVSKERSCLGHLHGANTEKKTHLYAYHLYLYLYQYNLYVCI